MLNLKLFTLTFLYFIQGLPDGFQSKVIPLYLREKGLSYTGLSLSKLLLIPWFCKVLFAPLVDNFYTHSIWLKISLYSLCVTAFITAVFLANTFLGLAVSLFVLNSFTAIQDISVDALAISVLKEDEMGKGNTAQVVGYKLGALVGGAFLFWIQSVFNIEGLFYTLAIVYFQAVILYSYIDPTSKNVAGKYVPKNQDKTKLSFSDLKKSLFTKKSISTVAFILIYKFGEMGCLTTFPIYLVDHKVSKNTVVFWVNLVGQVFSLLGSVAGGIIIKDNRKTVNVLIKSCLVRIIPMLAVWILVCFWESNSFPSSPLTIASIVTLITLQFIGGIISTVTFSIMMICSQEQKPSIQATHYSTLASFEVFGKLFFSSFIGMALDAYGFSFIYFILVILTLLPAVIVFIFKKNLLKYEKTQ